MRVTLGGLMAGRKGGSQAVSHCGTRRESTRDFGGAIRPAVPVGRGPGSGRTQRRTGRGGLLGTLSPRRTHWPCGVEAGGGFRRRGGKGWSGGR